MALDDPVVITCSISGSLANRDQCPAIPYTPEEYAAEARRIVDEGGVHIHIHARRPDGTPSYEIEDFQAISDAIRGEVGDAAIINFSTGAMGVTVEKRIAYLRAVRPEVAALNMGSMNYAKYSAHRKQFVFSAVFTNPFDEIIEFLGVMKELGIKPEHECFDLGHVGSVYPLIDMGVLEAPLHIDCVMGVVGGVRPTARNLAAMAAEVPDGSHWGVIGISREQWSLVAAALTLGGSIRVGLEDNFYLPNGEMARSNGDLIAKARQMCEDTGRRPATVDEARRLLGVKPRVAAASRAQGSGSHAAAARRVLHVVVRRPRRRGAEGRGHGDGRLRALGAAVLRGRRGQREVGPVPVAQPRQALDQAQPEGGARPRGAAAPRARVRRACRGQPARGDGPPRRRLRAARAGEPGARLLRDHRLRPGGPLPRPVRARHELPRPDRAARADRREGRPARPVGGADSRPWRRWTDGGLRDPGCAAGARSDGQGPARRCVDGRRRAVLAQHGRRPLLRGGHRTAARGARAGRSVDLLPAVRVQ